MSGGKCPGGTCPGGLCPRTILLTHFPEMFLFDQYYNLKQLQSDYYRKLLLTRFCYISTHNTIFFYTYSEKLSFSPFNSVCVIPIVLEYKE